MICRRCARDLPESRFRARDTGTRTYRLKVCSSCCVKKWDAKMRLEFLKAFGNKCSCCGETHPFFLTLEHINGAIDKHPAVTNSRCQYSKAKQEGWDRTKYEALCWNCNCAKGKYGQCPHRSGVTVEVAYEQLAKDAKNLAAQHRGFSLEEAARGRATRWAGKRNVDKVLSGIEKVSS